ncbi:MAG: hypothetical protein IPM74_02930 [Crocinitomicaceae bacterium]|nr:hypothetical protein [Crocinitomicaceae bacterium]MBK8924871.1 hypothetical protein [Crocinitomicaceae bacterium]
MKPIQKIFVSISSIALITACSQNQIQQDKPEQTDSTTITKAVFVPVEFEASDSLLISGNLYEVDPEFPLMILCHQRGFCKYEYAGVAERFNELGFNCLAIDQRCGGPIAENKNETWLRALEQNKPTDFLDAEKDIVAAIEWAYAKYQKPVIILGSSYSSTLCVYQALENEKVSAVIAFSPGNYFMDVRGDLTKQLVDFEKPFFFTAAREEMPFVRELVLGRPRSETQVVFSPEGEGMHGARVLWPTQEGGEEYWNALEDFLEKIKHAPAQPEGLAQ